MDRYDVRLRNRIHHINVYIRSLSIREDIRVRNRLVLITNSARTELRKTIQPDESGLVLDTSVGNWVTRTTFEKVVNELCLDSIIGDIFSQKAVYGLEADMALDVNVINAIRELHVCCDNLLEFSEESAPKAIKTSYFGGSDDLYLESQIVREDVIKYVPISLEAELVSSVHTMVERLCSTTTSEMELGGSVSMLLTGYRMLFEMDSDDTNDLNLFDFDEMSLEDIDYVVY